MNFFDVVRARHSIRAYQPRPVEEEKLLEILKAANAAPSAGNLQAYEIVVVRDEASRHALALAASGQDFIWGAPVVLVFCANLQRSERKYGKRGVELYCLQDATIACAYAQLAATALGLGSVWVGAFRTGAVAQAVQTPVHWYPVALLPIGYPAEAPETTARRALANIVHEIASRESLRVAS